MRLFSSRVFPSVIALVVDPSFSSQSAASNVLTNEAMEFQIYFIRNGESIKEDGSYVIRWRPADLSERTKIRSLHLPSG